MIVAKQQWSQYIVALSLPSILNKILTQLNNEWKELFPSHTKSMYEQTTAQKFHLRKKKLKVERLIAWLQVTVSEMLLYNNEDNYQKLFWSSLNSVFRTILPQSDYKELLRLNYQAFRHYNDISILLFMAKTLSNFYQYAK